MALASLTWAPNGVLTDATTVTVQVDRLDTGVNVVPAGTATVHAGTGLYTYNLSALDATLPYKATWTLVSPTGTDTVTEDVWPQSPAVCTLADVERELAARIGNHWVDTVSYGDTLHIGTLYQTSNIPLGGWAELWVLRRGVMSDGTSVGGFVATDRERRVKADPDNLGKIELDRSYTVAPVVGELVEFHALQPSLQLRPSVLRGLHRIKFVDRTSVPTITAKAERDVSALCPWIVQEEQILGLELVYPGTIYVPTKVKSWGTFNQDGHVWIWATPDAYPFQLLISHWRRADTLINGTYAANYQKAGVAQDSDGIHVDLTWAGAAAHIEAWRYFPGVLQPASRTGLSMSKKDAADDYTQKGREFVRVPKTPWELGKTRDRSFLQHP